MKETETVNGQEINKNIAYECLLLKRIQKSVKDEKNGGQMATEPKLKGEDC